jgi:hypothetical protein
MKEERPYFKLVGHSTRGHGQFDGNATAFMASESVLWQVPGAGGLTRPEIGRCARRARYAAGNLQRNGPSQMLFRRVSAKEVSRGYFRLGRGSRGRVCLAQCFACAACILCDPVGALRVTLRLGKGFERPITADAQAAKLHETTMTIKP